MREAQRMVGARPTAGTLLRLLRDTVTAWRDDYAPSMGAALAYYTVFSVAPLLLIVIAVAGLAYGDEARAWRGCGADRWPGGR